MGIKKFFKNGAESAKGALGSVVDMAVGTAGTMVNDAFIEYFVCGKFTDDTLMVPAQQVQRNVNKVGKANSKGTENLISNGSVFDVAVNQCAILVENGKVHDCVIVTEQNSQDAGQYQYLSNLEPSWAMPLGPDGVGFGGETNPGVKAALLSFWDSYKKRIVAGGQSTNTMNLFYINLRPLLEVKIGAGNILVRDRNIGQTITLGVNGTVIVQIKNPVLFYERYVRDATRPFTLSSEEGKSYYQSIRRSLSNNLAVSVKKIATQFSDWWEFNDHREELKDALTEATLDEMLSTYGVAIYNVQAEASMDEKQFQQLQEFDALARTGSNQSIMAAKLLEGQLDVAKTAAGNSNGAMMGFMGMNAAMMGMNAGDMAGYVGNPANFQQQPVQQAPQQVNQYGYSQPVQPAQPAPVQQSAPVQQTPVQPAPVQPDPAQPTPVPTPATADDTWACPSCGASNSGARFCIDCGTPKPAPAPVAAPVPANDSWECPNCHSVNTSRFCKDCGTKKPDPVKNYRCSSCGYNPPDPTKPPKFCPDCGDIFDDNDIIS